MNTTTYQLKIVKELDESLINEWKQLWETAENANIFNSYEWFNNSQKTEKFTNYEIHTCYSEGKLVAILPLIPTKHFGINTWGVVGGTFLVNTAFLVERYDTVLLKHFFTDIFAKKSIVMHKTDSQATEKLHDVFPKLFSTIISANPSVYVKEDPLASVSKSTISQIRKMIRKNPDQVSFTLFSGKENLQEQLQTMFDIDLHSGKRAKSLDVFLEEWNKNFYRAIVETYSDKARLGFLYYNNVAVAYQFGFLYRKTFLAFQTSYLNEYRNFRPGKTMLIYLLENLKDQIEMLDLGGGMSSYKQEFTPDYNLFYDVSYSKNIFVMWWWKLINFVRRQKQIYFPLKHSKDHEFLFKTMQ